jgi:NAD(P)-dependent dehydrogenase (short-subunit alcohol dehydrogenase family)
MDLDLTGKRALVTGSTRGIGFATAAGLAGWGAEVIVNGRDGAAVAEAIAKIKQATPNARLHAAAFDFGNAQGCAALIAAFPHVDILVNSLGIYEPKAFFDIEDADWSKMFEVNVMSGVRLTRHYLKGMLDRNDWGRVVFVSSESGIYVPKEMVHYGFSKGAQLVIARGAAEHRHHGQFGAAGSDLGRDGAGAPRRASQGDGHHRRRSRRTHLHRAAAGLAAAALRQA